MADTGRDPPQPPTHAGEESSSTAPPDDDRDPAAECCEACHYWHREGKESKKKKTGWCYRWAEFHYYARRGSGRPFRAGARSGVSTKAHDWCARFAWRGTVKSKNGPVIHIDIPEEAEHEPE